MSAAAELLRATILHTPRNPFNTEHALEAFADGAVVLSEGRIRAAGDYTAVASAHPGAEVRDWRGSVILPGFIDTHIHFPQTRIIGGLGWPLLDWLRLHALPEELRMADTDYARAVAAEFVHELARHGTTTALVFGAHFGPATECLFEAADAAGLRIASGLVLSDRNLPDPLCQTPAEADRLSRSLIARYHGRGLLRYAVTPRFALSATEPMLEVCQALLRDHPDVLFTTHLNENCQEIAEVAAAFPWAANYLAVYDRFGLCGARSVFAHNVHTTDAELSCLSDNGAAVAHCPSSNAMLASGIFPLRRHLAARVRFALGTDVGAGTGFGMLKEALQCHMMQRVAKDAITVTPAQLLYLATAAGADALGLSAETGDFSPGKSADLVRIEPLPGTPLAAAFERAETHDALLAALIAQAGTETIREVRVAGKVV